MSGLNRSDRQVGIKTKQATRQKIIDAACTEFATHGEAGARVDRIAAAAGVNKAMIYYHFDSKENLYFEVVGAHLKKIAGMIAHEVDQPKSLEQILGGLAAAYRTIFDQDQEFRAIMLRELAQPRAKFLDQVAGIFADSGVPTKMLAAIRTGTKAKQLQSVDPKQAVVAWLSMNIGYFMLAPFIDRVLGITNRSKFVKARPKAVVDIFLNGLKAR